MSAGFLDKRVYTEGAIVKEGQTLFLMDQKPFKAQLDQAQAALAEQQAALDVARKNLARVKPLAAANALSQKELDDATGQFQTASAAVAQAKAVVEQAQLNLSYTVIKSPVDGITSYAHTGGRDLPQSRQQPTHHRRRAIAELCQFQPLGKRQVEVSRRSREGAVARSPRTRTSLRRSFSQTARSSHTVVR